MEEKRRDCKGSDMESSEAEEMELRRGPWTMDEDIKLMNYIAHNGEGRWNSLARCAGLKRTGKSCRLRWLNYLRPDVRRGNITLQEQLLILELHSRWGNRWSKIAQHLPGRTDNEIKNYWRTRVQKHAKQLKCDVNSKLFKDTIRNLWMPRLIEQHLQAQSKSQTSSTTHLYDNTFDNSNLQPSSSNSESFGTQFSPISDQADICNIPVKDGMNPENYSIQNSNFPANDNLPQGYFQTSYENIGYDIPFASPSSLSYFNQGSDFQSMQPNNQSFEFSDANLDSLWNDDDSWYSFSQEQIHDILEKN